MCAFLVAVVYLVVHWRYKVESLSVFIFPLVFVMTLVATLGNPVSAWTSPIVRNTWLTVHIVLVLLGYAALLFTAVASLLYLFQERELKSKKPRKFYYRLPPLGTLDELISKFMAIGFVLITLAVIAGSTWAFIELKADWIRQPKIAISFFTWGIYLALVFLRVTAGWRGRKAAIMTVDRARLFRGHLGGARAPREPPAETMKLLITGVSHKTAPVEVRECLAFREETLPAALADLKSREGVTEAVILSTCNRVEITVTTDDAADPQAIVDSFLRRPQSRQRRRHRRRTSTGTKAATPSIISSASPPAWIPWWSASRRFSASSRPPTPRPRIAARSAAGWTAC